jgi:hypothetical protein
MQRRPSAGALRPPLGFARSDTLIAEAYVAERFALTFRLLRGCVSIRRDQILGRFQVLRLTANRTSCNTSVYEKPAPVSVGVTPEFSPAAQARLWVTSAGIGASPRRPGIRSAEA